MREKILAFLKTQTQPVDAPTIKRHLGLNPVFMNSEFNNAIKNKKIKVTQVKTSTYPINYYSVSTTTP